MQNQSLRYLSLVIAIFWAGLIYYLSDQPGADTPMAFPQLDKLFHVVVYAVLGFFGMGALEAASHGYRPWQVWLITAIVSLYAMLDEFHQRFIPGRNADTYDVLADIAGGLLGVWLMVMLVKTFCKKCDSSSPAGG